MSFFLSFRHKVLYNVYHRCDIVELRRIVHDVIERISNALSIVLGSC